MRRQSSAPCVSHHGRHGRSCQMSCLVPGKPGACAIVDSARCPPVAPRLQCARKQPTAATAPTSVWFPELGDARLLADSTGAFSAGEAGSPSLTDKRLASGGLYQNSSDRTKTNCGKTKLPNCGPFCLLAGFQPTGSIPAPVASWATSPPISGGMGSGNAPRSGSLRSAVQLGRPWDTPVPARRKSTLFPLIPHPFWQPAKRQQRKCSQ